jgi:hypothetical protein
LPRYDLVVASYVLTELRTPEERQRLVRQLWGACVAHTAEGGQGKVAYSSEGNAPGEVCGSCSVGAPMLLAPIVVCPCPHC